jgi:hypothetical protein
LAATPLGALLGTGPGRGVGLMFVASAAVLLATSGLVYLNPRVRRVESELPDAVVKTEPEPEGGNPAAVLAPG